MDAILNYIHSFTNRFVIYTDDIYPVDELDDIVGSEYVDVLFHLRETDVEQFKHNYLSIMFTECIFIDILLYNGQYYMFAHDDTEFKNVSLNDIFTKIYEFIHSNWDYHGLDDDIRNIPSRQRDEPEYEPYYTFTQTKRRKITE